MNKTAETSKLMDNDLKLSRYDTADYLNNEKMIKLYMEEAIKEGGDDPAFMMKVLCTIARARNMNQLAKKAGITRAGLYKALAPGAKPRIDTVGKIANALGFSLSLVRKA